MDTCPNCGRPFDGHRHPGNACEVCNAGTHGMADPSRAKLYVAHRLEALRAEIGNERISYGEIAELQGLAKWIDPSDVDLLQWAGVPEFPEEEAVGGTFTVKIDVGNEAFQPDPSGELARILRRIASDIQGGDYSTFQTILDVNGNDVGRYALKPDSYYREGGN